MRDLLQIALILLGLFSLSAHAESELCGSALQNKILVSIQNSNSQNLPDHQIPVSVSHPSLPKNSEVYLIGKTNRRGLPTYLFAELKTKSLIYLPQSLVQFKDHDAIVDVEVRQLTFPLKQRDYNCFDHAVANALSDMGIETRDSTLTPPVLKTKLPKRLGQKFAFYRHMKSLNVKYTSSKSKRRVIRSLLNGDGAILIFNSEDDPSKTGRFILRSKTEFSEHTVEHFVKPAKNFGNRREGHGVYAPLAIVRNDCVRILLVADSALGEFILWDEMDFRSGLASEYIIF